MNKSIKKMKRKYNLYYYGEIELIKKKYEILNIKY